MSRKKRKQVSEKHVYSSSSIFYSSGWCTADYRNSDIQRELDRKKKKEVRSDQLLDIERFCEQEEIYSFSLLVKRITREFPELRQTVIENYSYLNYFLNSRRYDVSCGFAKESYKDVCKHLKAAELRNLELDDKVNDLWEIINKKASENTQLKESLAALQGSFEHSQLLCNSLIKRNLELQEMLSFEKLDLD